MTTELEDLQEYIAELKTELREAKARNDLLAKWLDEATHCAGSAFGWGRCYCTKDNHEQCLWEVNKKHFLSMREVINKILRKPSFPDTVYPKGHYHGD